MVRKLVSYIVFIWADVVEIMGKGLSNPQQAMPYHKYAGDVYTRQDQQCVSGTLSYSFF